MNTPILSPLTSRALRATCLVLFALVSASMSVSALAEHGKSVVYEQAGQAYEGYFVSPGESAPLLLLLHDWDGLTDYEKKRAHMLAELGYAVFAADLFGQGVRPTKVEDKRQHTGELYKDREKMRGLMQAAMAKGAALQGSATHAAFGYCFGGAAALELARSGADLKGFASFHGGLSTPTGQNYSATKGKVLVFHGTADSMISMTDFAGLADQLEAEGVAHEMITYSGAPHAFTVFGSDRYQAQADEQSWARFTAYLKASQ